MRAVPRLFACLAIPLLGLLISSIASQTASAQTNVLFIVDSSGSMRAKVEGKETRMSVAKRALSLALKDMPKDARLGMMLYGHRRAKDCKDIELVAPIASENANALADRVEALQPRGETPIAAALELAARSFAAFKGQNNMIVLVTDGIEECGGDPCAAARAIKAAGLNLKAHIVGFNLSAKQRAAIQCVVKETGGTYFDARNARGLRDALQNVKKQIAEPAPPAPPPERFSLIARKNGGEAIFVSNQYWAATIDGSLEEVRAQLDGIRVGQEAVYVFRDGSAAKFSEFALYIPGASAANPKEIELFAGDEGPTGPFRSLGVITVANGKLRHGWQQFKLPETTAKYFRVQIRSNYGENLGRISLYEVQLYGETIRADASPPPAPKARVNILASRAGAEILTGADSHWAQMIDGELASIGGDLSGLRVGYEAVFKFRGGAAAALDTFAIFIPGMSDRHPKEIEVSAGDAPAGPFRSLGVFTIANGKLRDGWQEFKLPDTTATFVKIKLTSNHGAGLGRLHLYELRLYGELK